MTELNIMLSPRPNPSFGPGPEPPVGWTIPEVLVLDTEKLERHIAQSVASYRYSHADCAELRVIIGRDVLDTVSKSVPDLLDKTAAQLHLGYVYNVPVLFVASIQGTAVVPV